MTNTNFYDSNWIYKKGHPAQTIMVSYGPSRRATLLY